MADLDPYPAFDQQLKSAPYPIDDVVIDRSVSLAARGRSFATAPKLGFNLVHQLVAADWATLWALYLANRTLRVTLTWNQDASTHVCFFKSPPRYTFNPEAPLLYDVTAVLEEQ